MSTLPRLVNGFFPNWIDLNGGQANSLWTALDQSDGGFGPWGSVVSAAQNLSVAGLFGGVIQVRSLPGATPGGGLYPLVTDQLVLRIESGNYGTNVMIPAPKSDLFLADTITANLSDSRITEFFSALQGVGGDSTGSPWINLVFGQRRQINLRGS
jgi:hypothetical protein